MSWVTDFTKFGHRMFITFIEMKIEGPWKRHVQSFGGRAIHYEVLTASDEDNCYVHFIEPDGLRRILQFTMGGTLAVHQNVLSYHPEQVSEMAVDEKEQSGKGKSRASLS